MARILPSDSDRADDDRPWAPKKPTNYGKWRFNLQLCHAVQEMSHVQRIFVAKNQDSNTLNFGSPDSNDSKAECSTPTRQTGGC